MIRQNKKYTWSQIEDALKDTILSSETKELPVKRWDAQNTLQLFVKYLCGKGGEKNE